jgi:RNA polymerase sigma-70 factor (ECF subfamily)
LDDLDRYLPLIAAGDPDAFAQWVAGAEPRVRASLLRFAAHVDVEAIVQECLLRMWQVAPRVRVDGANSLLRLSIRSARNLAISDLRRRGARPEVLSAMESTHEPPQPPVRPDPMLRRVIAACRDKLPNKPALVLGLRLARAADPDRDLAAAAGMKLNTFLQNFGRARKLLAQCLRKHGVDVEAELA